MNIKRLNQENKYEFERFRSEFGRDEKSFNPAIMRKGYYSECIKWKNVKYFGYFEGDKIIGMCSLQDNGVIGYGVSPEYRGKGIADRMIRFLETQADYLNAEIVNTNWRSILLLARNGFRVYRELKDRVYMEKTLC